MTFDERKMEGGTVVDYVFRIFTPEELKLVKELAPDAIAIDHQVTGPALDRINAETNQANDSRYWAYVLLFVFDSCPDFMQAIIDKELELVWKKE